METGHIYIFAVHSNSPFKCKILEITEHTLLLQNLDVNSIFRATKEVFNLRYNIIEYIGNEPPQYLKD